jgi:hypothetical protein
MGKMGKRDTDDTMHSNIGKSGNTKGAQSTAGGQFPFLPNTYSGRHGGSKSGGVSSDTNITQIPFLPNKVKPIGKGTSGS